MAAVLALCELGGGRYGHEQILAANEKAQSYSWSQHKAVKRSLAEGEASFLKGLLAADAIDKPKVPAVTTYGTLYLQLGIEMGAVAVVVRSLMAKRILDGAMVVLGLCGTYYAYVGYQAAWLVH